MEATSSLTQKEYIQLEFDFRSVLQKIFIQLKFHFDVCVNTSKEIIEKKKAEIQKAKEIKRTQKLQLKQLIDVIKNTLIQLEMDFREFCKVTEPTHEPTHESKGEKETKEERTTREKIEEITKRIMKANEDTKVAEALIKEIKKDTSERRIAKIRNKALKLNTEQIANLEEKVFELELTMTKIKRQSAKTAVLIDEIETILGLREAIKYERLSPVS